MRRTKAPGTAACRNNAKDDCLPIQFFNHDGFELAFLDRRPDSGAGDPVLLIHGFASSHFVNWVSPGWFKTLNDAGYRTIALDNRGHGASAKSYDSSDYTPQKMAGDASALLAHLGVPQAHVMGYSMGARVAAFMALAEPQLVATLIFGGLGSGLVDGVGDWDPIASALLAEDAASVTHPPWATFSALAPKKARSIVRNAAMTLMAAACGHFHRSVITT